MESGVLNAAEKEERSRRAVELERQATGYLTEARAAFQELLASGEMPASAHYHLFQVATHEHDFKTAVKHAEEFRKEAARRQAFLARQLETSFDAALEVTLRNQQRELKGQEVDVLGQLANIAFKTKDFAGSAGYLDQLLTLDSTRTAEYLNRARCLVALKNYTRAKADVEVFLRQTQLPFESIQVKEALELRRKLEQQALSETSEAPGKPPLGDGEPRRG